MDDDLEFDHEEEWAFFEVVAAERLFSEPGARGRFLLVRPDWLRETVFALIDEMESWDGARRVRDVSLEAVPPGDSGSFGLQGTLDPSPEMDLASPTRVVAWNGARVCLAVLGYYACLVAHVGVAGLPAGFRALDPESLFVVWTTLTCEGTLGRSRDCTYRQLRDVFHGLAEGCLEPGGWCQDSSVQCSAGQRVQEFSLQSLRWVVSSVSM